MKGAPLPLKTCPKCGETKPHAAFYHKSKNKDGLSDWCRGCERLSKSPQRKTAWYERRRAYQ